jgi:RNA polymerase-interacting CarD/CdnL/TRCF family regulator
VSAAELESVSVMERVRKHRKFLQHLISNGDLVRQNEKSIRGANRGEICTICELVKNLLKNPSLKLNLSGEEKQLLLEHRELLEELINRRIPLKRKKRILQRGAGILIPLVLTLMGPILNKLLQS